MKRVRFYVNVNKLIVGAIVCICFGLYLNYCKKSGKDPVEPIVKVVNDRGF